MLSAIVSLPASCDLLASYAAMPLAAARNKAPGFQASFGVRKWVARVGVFKAAPPLPAVIRAAQRTGGGAAAGSDDESAVCFAPRQRVPPPPPMDSRSDPRSRSPDNDVL